MAEEVLETGAEESTEEGNPRKDPVSRINQLSQKLAEEAKSKEKEAKAREKAEAEAQAAARERDFYKNINPLLREFPDAAEFQDEIKEKVNKGYDVKDATIAVLHGKSKLSPKQAEKEMIAGGSATTNVQAGAGKSVEDLIKNGSQADRKAKLKELVG